MSKPKTKKASPARPSVPEEAAAALAAIEHELTVLSPEALLPINVDIPRAVAVAVGALPHIAAQRPQIVASLPDHPRHSIDKLGTYALAAWYAHLLALPSAKAPGALEALLAEATPLREDLLVAAEALAHKNLLEADTVAEIRSGQGNLDKANDLVALAALFTQRWSHVHGKTTVTVEDIERAAKLGPALLVALGAREQPLAAAPGAMSPNEQRARAYTLFVNAYDEARRAISYLRWHEDDVDEIAPSLFASRKPARKARAGEGEAAPSIGEGG